MTIKTRHRHAVALIDENHNHRLEVSEALLSFYDIDLYDDSKTVIAKINNNIPDLILVGSSDNPAQTLGFISRLRQEEDLSTIPLIFIANNKNQQLIEKAETLGANSVIIKPYLRSALINAISTLINANIEKSWEELPPLQKQALKGTVAAFNSIADVISAGEPLQFNEVKDACVPLVEAIKNNDFSTLNKNLKHLASNIKIIDS